MAMQGGDEVNARIAQAIPTGRIGQPEEVAYAVAMLCTDAAAFTTGACLDINGGVFMN
ncbi:3-oxoacyl-[acyl-carrier-protein] reductase FabG [compost metagenome]